MKPASILVSIGGRIRCEATGAAAVGSAKDAWGPSPDEIAALAADCVILTRLARCWSFISFCLYPPSRWSCQCNDGANFTPCELIIVTTPQEPVTRPLVDGRVITLTMMPSVSTGIYPFTSPSVYSLVSRGGWCSLQKKSSPRRYIAGLEFPFLAPLVASQPAPPQNWPLQFTPGCFPMMLMQWLLKVQDLQSLNETPFEQSLYPWELDGLVSLTVLCCVVCRGGACWVWCMQQMVHIDCVIIKIWRRSTKAITETECIRRC